MSNYLNVRCFLIWEAGEIIGVRLMGDADTNAESAVFCNTLGAQLNNRCGKILVEKELGAITFAITKGESGTIDECVSFSIGEREALALEHLLFNKVVRSLCRANGAFHITVKGKEKCGEGIELPLATLF